jgi:hypothetical protein
MTDYRRNFVPGGCQFFTVNLASLPFPNPTFPTGAPILEFRRRKLNLFKGR